MAYGSRVNSIKTVFKAARGMSLNEFLSINIPHIPDNNGILNLRNIIGYFVLSIKPC